MALHVQLFGSPTVFRVNESNTPNLTKPTLLLLFLAFRQIKCSRNELAFLFRADASESIAQGYLRKLLYRAKQFSWSEGLEYNKTHLRWSVETDVKQFNRAFDAKQWQTVIDLYSGTLLEGVAIDDAPAYHAWLELERLELERKWVTASQKRIQELEQEGDLSTAVKLVERICKRDNYNEMLLQTHLSLLFQDEREKDAMQLYKDFCKKLKFEFDVEPLESTQALVDNFKNQDSNKAKLVSKNIKKHNLPEQTTRFVGRKQEIEILTETFQKEECRFLTVVGLGGTGKTRLALEFARSQLKHFKDGVFFVPLAGVLHGDTLVSTMADGIGLMLSGSDDVIEQLSRYLEKKAILLLLDNFEQLKQHAILLDQLLMRCPSIKFLVTSREALELQSEWLIDLYGLDYPKTDAYNLEASDAVQLFLNRAERVSSQFIKTPDALQSIAEISRFVEGMPLALELAATWTRSLDCQEISKTLQTELDILSSNYQNLPERQRSMVKVFDTSFSQMGEQEQSTLIGLAIFEGGFDFEAAYEITGAHLALLMSLINRSLVRRHKTGRYSIHELLRQYLNNKPHSENEQLEIAYSKHFLNRLDLAAYNMYGPKPQSTAEYIIEDLENIRKAYSFATMQEDWQTLLKCHTGIKSVFYRLGRWQEAAVIYQKLYNKLISKVVSKDGADLKTLVEMALSYTSWYLKQTSYEFDQTHYEKLLENETNSQVRLELRFHIAHYLHVKGLWDEAEASLLACLEEAKLADYHSKTWQSVIFEQLHLIPWITGDYEKAANYARAWLELSEKFKDVTYIVDASLILHNRLNLIGAPGADSDSLLQNAIKYYDEVTPRTKAFIQQGFGLFYYAQKDYESSVAKLKAATELISQTSDNRNAALISYSLGRSLKELERFDEAINATRHSMDLLLFATLQYGALAEIERARGDIILAKKYIVSALDAYVNDPQPVFILLNTFITLSIIHKHNEDYLEALQLAQYAYNHQSSTSVQKRQLEEIFERSDLQSRVCYRPLDEILQKQQKLLET